MNEIFSKLIRIRKDKRVDQKYLAQYLNITSTTMSRYESGKRHIPVDLLIKYADYLGYELKLMVK